MAFLQISAVNFAFGEREILKNANLFLKDGSRAALCGANGSGKTTLLKLLNGEIQADSGERVLEKAARVAYLPQSGAAYTGRTLYEETESAFAPLAALLEEINAIGAKLEASKHDDSCTAGLVESQHKLITQVEESGYYYREKQISKTLLGLGFNEADFERNCAEFSGGWQMRIALAKTLLSSPDILLLDEPTNYLDIEARNWLEELLGRFSGALLIVSHDRYFIDVIVNEVYELFNGRLNRYTGNYSVYEKTRAAEIENMIKLRNAQEDEIAKTEELIQRFRYKASKAAFVQERIKKLKKIELVSIPENLKKIEIKLPTPPHSGKIALTIENLCKNYGKNDVITAMDLVLKTGERLCVVGVNGSGKSSLLRIIAGADTGTNGIVRYGTGIIPAYFNQDAAETIKGGESVLDYLEARATPASMPRLRDMAGAFLFRNDDIYKSLGMLSGGEKSRLALLSLLLSPSNLLILDEPTNHLDIASKDILLNALLKWDGTVIFVSHDRAFMEALSTKTLELQRGAKHKLFYGNYAYYLSRAVESEINSTKTESYSKIKKQNNEENDNQSLKKAQKALIKRQEREEKILIMKIEELEKTKTGLEAELSSPDVYTSGEKTKAITTKLNTLMAEIEKTTAQWEALYTEQSSGRGFFNTP
jgi:ATP-binding cassette subfamily F protein 3